VTPVTKWRAIDPLGEIVARAGTRRDAIFNAYDSLHIPHMPHAVMRNLDNVNDRTAGWAAIESRGWKIEPDI
jgi:hypothetical protein